MKPILLTALILLLLILPSGCGDEKKKGASSKSAHSDFTPPSVPAMKMTQLPAKLAALLPEDCRFVLHMPSAGDLSTLFAPLTKAAGAPDFDPYEPFRMHPAADLLINSGHVRDDRPLVLGLSLLMGGMMPQPMPTILLPVRDPAAAIAAIPDMGLPPAIASGEYLVLRLAPASAPGGMAQVSFPESPMSFYCDLAGLVRQFRPLIEMGLAAVQGGMAQQSQQLGMQGADQMAVAYIGAFRKMLDSAGSLDSGFWLEDGEYVVHMNFTALDGSPLSQFATGKGSDLWQIAGTLDPKNPFAAVFGGDPEKMIEATRPLMSAAYAMYPPEVGAKLSVWMEEFMPLLEQIRGSLTMSGGFGASGVHMQTFCAVEEGKGFLEEYLALLTKNPVAGMGMQLSPPETRTTGSTKVYDLTAEYDFEKLMGPGVGADSAELEKMMEQMYGKDGLRMSVAAHDNVFAFVMGQDPKGVDAAIAKIGASPSALSTDLQRAIARVNGAPMSFAGQVDLTEFMKAAGRAAAADMPGQPGIDLAALEAVAPTPVCGWGSGEGAKWHFGFSVPAQSISNLTELQKAIEAQGGF